MNETKNPSTLQEKTFYDPHDGYAGFRTKVLSDSMVKWIKTLDGQTLPLQQAVAHIQFVTKGYATTSKEYNYIALYLVEGEDLRFLRPDAPEENAVDTIIRKFGTIRQIKLVNLIRFRDPNPETENLLPKIP